MAGTGGQIGGTGNPVVRAIWVFIAACIVVAILGGAPRDPAAFVDNLQTGAARLERTVTRWVHQTPIPGTTGTETATGNGTRADTKNTHPSQQHTR